MHKKKHKRKVSRIIIFTTDAVDAKTRQFKLRPWTFRVFTLFVCLLIGGLIGYVAYEGQIWALDRAKDARQADNVAALEEQISILESEIESLNTEKEAMALAINENVLVTEELQSQLEQQSLPTDYPLTGSAGIEEVTEGEPMVIFSASDGITVVASAKGTVAAVEEDETYGYKITIDHGNGYVSIYRNSGEAQVKAGDEAAKGTTLFLIGTDNKTLVYQIMKDGEYIRPTEMLSIDG